MLFILRRVMMAMFTFICRHAALLLMFVYFFSMPLSASDARMRGCAPPPRFAMQVFDDASPFLFDEARALCMKV